MSPSFIEKVGSPSTTKILQPEAARPSGLMEAHGLGASVPREQIDYGALLRRYRGIICVIMVLCLSAGGLYTWLAPRTYRAEMVLEITSLNQDFINAHDINPNEGGTDQSSYIETQIMLLRNEAIGDRVVGAVASRVPAALAQGQQGQEAVVRKMLRTGRINEEGGSNLIRIILFGPDANLVATTANELASQYMLEEQHAHISAASNTGEFLDQQLEEARSNLLRSEDALQEYARQSGIVLTSDTRESIATEHLRQLQQGLAQAEVEGANRQAQSETAQRAAVESLPEVVDDPTIRADREKLADLHRQLAELGTTMTPANYKVQQIQAQVQGLEADIRAHENLIVNRLLVEERTAQRRRDLLQRQYGNQLAAVTGEGTKQVRYNMLRHDVEVNRQIYQSLTQKVKEAGIIAAMRASNARVVSAASPPSSPYAPKPYVSVPLGALAGLVLSMLSVLLLERKNNSVRSPGESEQYTARPELAVIPWVRLSSKLPRTSSVSILGATKKQILHPLLAHWQASDESILAEAYRFAGTSILFSEGLGSMSQTLVVTSPGPQCGKTTTTANLGISLAEGGRRILLVDGDVRKPTLPKLFGIDNSCGLFNLLEGEQNIDPHELILATPFAGVYILPGGVAKGSVVKLLHSDTLRLILGTLRPEFNFILMDAPPLLGLADARILSRLADGVILVCHAGRTRFQDLQEARKQLLEDGTHIVGTILNGYNLERERPYYYRGYSGYTKQPSA